MAKKIEIYNSNGTIFDSSKKAIDRNHAAINKEISRRAIALLVVLAINIVIGIAISTLIHTSSNPTSASFGYAPIGYCLSLATLVFGIRFINSLLKKVNKSATVVVLCITIFCIVLFCIVTIIH